ncbi:MAG: hypothetical protein ACTHQE_06930 [Thermomicrobiales bacterium]|jgi:predicted nucleotidyltransferase
MHEHPDANTRLLTFAAELAPMYQQHPAIAGALLVGSAARGWADAWSDIELLFVVTEPLSLVDRSAIAQRAGLTSRRVFGAAEGLGIEEEDGVFRGTKADLAFTPERMQALLDDVTVRASLSPKKHAIVAGIRDGQVLHADVALTVWKEQATVYPARLRRDMIENNLIFGPHRFLEMLAARQDLLLLNDILVRIGRALVNIVFALNSTFAVSDMGKWAFRALAPLPLHPTHFVERLSIMFTASPGRAVGEAGDLITEILDLVQHHVPAIDTTGVTARFNERRS